MAGLPQGRVTNDANNYFAIGIQSAKDTDATTFYFLKHLDGTGFDVDVTANSERVGGSGREVGLRYRSKVTADGQYAAYAQPDFAGRVLTAALGTDTVTGSAGGFFTHTIVSGGSQLPYQTFEQAWADETERTTNCLISDLKIEGEAGRPVKMTAQFMSGGTAHPQSTLLSPVREAAFPLMVPGGSACITATGNLSPGGQGASSLQLTKWSVDIKNALDGDIQTNALNREDMLWLTSDYDIDGTFKYIDNNFWEAVRYGGATQVPTGLLTSGQFSFFTPGASGGSLTLLAPYVEFTTLKVNRLDPDGKTMYIDFVASTRGIGTQSLQATVQSGAATSYQLSTT
jgi:hypothetical protein